MWTQVSSAVGGAAGIVATTTAAAATGAAGATSGAGGTGGAVVAGGVSAAKMLALGVLLGGTVTVGMAATLLHVGSVSPKVSPKATSSAAVMTAPPPTSAATAAQPSGGASSARAGLASNEAASPSAQAPAVVAGNDALTEGAVAAPAPRAVHAAHARPARKLDDPSSLSLEASLITEARAALVNGDALTALRKARTARALPARQLVPEELTVEAQALRALGRDSEAAGIDQALRAQYPESALAR
jgi:hypothetical protein